MQVLLKWNVQRGVPVMPKASSRQHLVANLEGMFSWRLSYEQKVQGLCNVEDLAVMYRMMICCAELCCAVLCTQKGHGVPCCAWQRAPVLLCCSAVLCCVRAAS